MNHYWSYGKHTSGLFHHRTGVWEESDNRIIRKAVAFGGKRSIDFGKQASFDGWVFTDVINRKAEGVCYLVQEEQTGFQVRTDIAFLTS